MLSQRMLTKSALQSSSVAKCCAPARMSALGKLRRSIESLRERQLWAGHVSYVAVRPRLCKARFLRLADMQTWPRLIYTPFVPSLRTVRRFPSIKCDGVVAFPNWDRPDEELKSSFSVVGMLFLILGEMDSTLDNLILMIPHFCLLYADNHLIPDSLKQVPLRSRRSEYMPTIKSQISCASSSPSRVLRKILKRSRSPMPSRLGRSLWRISGIRRSGRSAAVRSAFL